jgi:hypothetical protein
MAATLSYQQTAKLQQMQFNIAPSLELQSALLSCCIWSFREHHMLVCLLSMYHLRPISASLLLPSTPPHDALFTQHPGTTHKQTSHVSTQKPHVLSLGSRQAQQTLRVGEVRIQLSQLRIEVRILSVFVRRCRMGCRGGGGTRERRGRSCGRVGRHIDLVEVEGCGCRWIRAIKAVGILATRRLPALWWSEGRELCRNTEMSPSTMTLDASGAETLN